MKYSTKIILGIAALTSPAISFGQKAADAASNTELGQHFGLSDQVWLGIFMGTASLFTIIILTVNMTIRNLAETKSLWKKGGAAALALVLSVGSAHAQSSEGSAEVIYAMSDTAFWAFIGVNAFLMGFALVQLRLLRGLTKKIAGIESVEPPFVEESRRRPMWEVIWKKINDHKEVAKEKDILLDHNYDGIRELDNNLPPWWKWGFYLSIVFAVLYLTHYHVTHTGALPEEELAMAMEEGEREVQEYLARAAMNVDETNVEFLADADRVDAGKSIYVANCLVCHGAYGEGGVGPNLTDPYWIHGGSINDLFKTVKYGVPAKGMKSWKSDLSPIQIQNVSTFILTMQGTNPDNQKEPQGELYEPEEPDVQKAEGETEEGESETDQEEEQELVGMVD